MTHPITDPNVLVNYPIYTPCARRHHGLPAPCTTT